MMIEMRPTRIDHSAQFVPTGRSGKGFTGLAVDVQLHSSKDVRYVTAAVHNAMKPEFGTRKSNLTPSQVS